jgi:hypothetical protein
MLLMSPQNREFAGPLVPLNVRMTHLVTFRPRSTAASVSEEFYSTHWLRDVRMGCDGVDRKACGRELVELVFTKRGPG